METKDLQDRIVIDPGIHHGDPVIRGTRIPVSVIVANFSDHTPDEILNAYPQLTRDDLRAALLFASQRARGKLAG